MNGMRILSTFLLGAAVFWLAKYGTPMILDKLYGYFPQLADNKWLKLGVELGVAGAGFAVGDMGLKALN